MTRADVIELSVLYERMENLDRLSSSRSKDTNAAKEEYEASVHALAEVSNHCREAAAQIAALEVKHGICR